MNRKLFTIIISLTILISLLSSGCNTGLPSPTLTSVTPVVATQTLPASQVPVIHTPTAINTPDLTAGLENLDFDSFVEESYRRLLLRDPETITELGLMQALGVRNNQLTNISDDYIRETQALDAAILDLLRRFDRQNLSSEQQLTLDIYTWYLDDRVRGQAFRYNDYPINPTIFSVHNDLLQFFSDIHPMTNLQDAQDYVHRLEQVEIKFEQLQEGLRLREQQGVILPRFLIPWIVSDLRTITEIPPRETPFYIVFATKLEGLSDLSSEDRQSVLKAAEEAIRTSVIPAYQALAEYLEQVEHVAPQQAGVGQFSNGKEYYIHMLRHHTSTELTPEQIHDLGLVELERIQSEMRSIFADLGYPEGASLPELYERAAWESGSATGTDIQATYERIIAAAKREVAPVFNLLPKADVIVVGGPTGGYYMPPAVDGSRPGMFYARTVGNEPLFGMPTLAYHEAIPGHHFQIAIAQEVDLPTFRRGAEFTAYTEGWALYAERLAYELGFYEGDPYGNLGRLQAEAFRAARLVVDTGIHAKGWSFNQAVDFMVENTGKERRDMEYEVSRYIVLPGQATAYYVGFLKILELRQKAKEAMGDQFDLKAFHDFLLKNGAMPLDTLEQLFENET